MTKEECRVHAVAWLGAAANVRGVYAAQKGLPSGRLMICLAVMAAEIGTAYSLIAQGQHPVTKEPLTAP